MRQRTVQLGRPSLGTRAVKVVVGSTFSYWDESIVNRKISKERKSEDPPPPRAAAVAFPSTADGRSPLAGTTLNKPGESSQPLGGCGMCSCGTFIFV